MQTKKSVPLSVVTKTQPILPAQAQTASVLKWEMNCKWKSFGKKRQSNFWVINIYCHRIVMWVCWTNHVGQVWESYGYGKVFGSQSRDSWVSRIADILRIGILQMRSFPGMFLCTTVCKIFPAKIVVFPLMCLIACYFLKWSGLLKLPRLRIELRLPITQKVLGIWK